MANTLITFAVTSEGKPLSVNVEMTGEELDAALALAGGGTLVRLRTGDANYTYVNPAHIVMARETTGIAVF